MSCIQPLPDSYYSDLREAHSSPYEDIYMKQEAEFLFIGSCPKWAIQVAL